MKQLGLEIPEYDSNIDPTKFDNGNDKNKILEWTIRKSYINDAQNLYDIYCKNKRRKVMKKYKKQKSNDEVIDLTSDGEDDN